MADNYELDFEDTEEYIDNSQSTEDSVKGKSKKNKKQKKEQSKKSKKDTDTTVTEEIPEIIPDRVLYILTDNQYSNMLEYAKSCGLNISGVFDNVDELKNLMLMQFNDMRVVVVDTGTGKFITPTIRKSIVDMIGLTDENTKFTVFYTDSLLKSDSSTELGKRAKEIEWVKYLSTPVLVASLLSKKENYISDGFNRTGAASSEQDILKFKGAVTPGVELEYINLPSINPFNIGKQVVDTDDESIRRFKLRI